MRTPSSRTSVSFVAGAVLTFVAVAVVAPGLLWNPAASFAIGACQNPNGHDYGTTQLQEDLFGPAYTAARGTRADLWVPLGNTSCQRIASVYVGDHHSYSIAEFGWVRGYFECTENTYSQPQLFYNYHYANNHRICNAILGNPAGGQYDSFRVSDTDGNSRWGAWWNGSERQPNGVLLEFNQGISYAATERSVASDNCYARWLDLEEYHDGNAWSPWDSLTFTLNDNPGCHSVKESADTGKVVVN